MATIRQRKGRGSWEVIIQRKGVLARPHRATADSYEEAVLYARRIEGLLDQGILPIELQAVANVPVQAVDAWIRAYLQSVAVSDSDVVLLNALLPLSAGWKTNAVTMQWAQGWIEGMKRVDRLAPVSIRHKVGAVARVLDWAMRNDWLISNPLRLLPKRYASYTAADGDKKLDVERDRRLMPGEYERIVAVIGGHVPYGQQRGIDRLHAESWLLLFVLAVETGMRLREMYTLTMEQVDITKRTIFLDKTKNGDKRQVPLSSIAVKALEGVAGFDGFLFPWWHGRQESLKRVTLKLSRKFGTIARLSGCYDLHFHDLRHEAVCRFYEKTTLSDVQIARITGHKDLRMLKRYASLRGSDLAALLW